MKKRKGIKLLTLLLAAALLLGGCSAAPEGTGDATQTGKESKGESTAQENGNSGSMGRYLEQEIAIGSMYSAMGLLQTDDGLLVVSGGGNAKDYLLKEGDEAELIDRSAYPEEYRKLLEEEAYFYDMAAAPNGAKIFTLFQYDEQAGTGTYPKYLLLSDGTMQEWNEVTDENTSSDFWYGGDGYFYAAIKEEETKVFRISSETGETEFLTETEDRIDRIFGNGVYLFLDTRSALSIFDLESKSFLEEDEVLNQALSQYLGASNGSKATQYLITAGDNSQSIYVVTPQGLFSHVLYGSVMEQVIDGTLCSMGDVTKYFTDMALDTAGQMAVFYLLYDDGRLLRFEFDETVPTVPDTVVRIYSLFNDNNIRLAISAYRAVHPEVYLKYEIGVEEGTAQTKDDALKNLATQLADGSGPDIIVTDGLPYDSYVEKGVLADISEIYEKAGEETLWENVVNAFRKGEALYAVPMVFRVPVITGDAQNIQNLNSLSDLADLLEKEEAVDGKCLLGMLYPENLVYAMGIASGGEWLENGSLNREALTEFLTQCQRIYEAEKKGLTQEQLDEMLQEIRQLKFGSTEAAQNLFADRIFAAESQLIISGLKGNPYSAGILGGDIKVSFNSYVAWLNSFDKSYELFPGKGNSCIVETVMGINQNSKVYQQAEEFLNYTLSEEFQKDTLLSGIPINKKAFYAQQENNLLDEEGNLQTGPYMSYGLSGEDGESLGVEVSWATEEQLAGYSALVESIDTVNRCDERVFSTVIEEGAAFLNGTKGIEEAVNAIEKKVQLYLAE